VPELPEVEYARRRLQRAMAGTRIQRVVVRRRKLRYALPADFARRLEGQAVRAVLRRAKYLLLELSSGDRLLMHLGMSGSFRVTRSNRRDASTRRYYHDTSRIETHDHVDFAMSNGATIVFNDPRRFGFMRLLTTDQHATHVPLARLGPEPLADTFDAAALAARLARRRTTLKSALSDQRVVAGLGNIYVVEALHRARLSPKRLASTLVTRTGQPRPAAHDLVQAIRNVLTDAIRRQYRTGADNPFLVYDREGEPCPRRGCRGTIRRITQGGRSTYYCPVCQR
jgi:formamidopyrimidine-DNA glycosylase